jgi:hypothetical protein
VRLTVECTQNSILMAMMIGGVVETTESEASSAFFPELAAARVFSSKKPAFEAGSSAAISLSKKSTTTAQPFKKYASMRIVLADVLHADIIGVRRWTVVADDFDDEDGSTQDDDIIDEVWPRHTCARSKEVVLMHENICVYAGHAPGRHGRGAEGGAAGLRDWCRRKEARVQELHLRVRCADGVPRSVREAAALTRWCERSLKDEEEKPVVSDKDLTQMVSSCGNVRLCCHRAASATLIPNSSACAAAISSATRATRSAAEAARSWASRRSSPAWRRCS